MNKLTDPIPEPADLYPDLPVEDPYYDSTAYNSRRIPDQPPQTEDHNRSGLNRRTNMRLPWGSTWEVAPDTLFSLSPPDILRKEEKHGHVMDGLGLNDHRIDHERYRHAPPALRTKLIVYLTAAGRALAFVLPPLTLFAFIVAIFSTPEYSSYTQQALEVLPAVLTFAGTPFACWGLGHALIHYLPGFTFKPGKGPLWEINRRTGMVTAFDYSQGRKKPQAISAPFYEFDAYVGSVPDRQGMPMHIFYFYHRYQKLEINLRAMLGVSHRGEYCFALWDMIQNYMDTSRPLPDLPMWEEFRHLDPVTAEYDRRTGRNPRYWRDMDDDTWKQKQDEMLQKVLRIDTLTRPNLMAEHVDYQV